MKLLEAHARLLALKQEVLRTADVAAVLRISMQYASQILKRLSDAGFFVPLAQGIWACSPKINPLAIPEYLTAPFPSYISFQTALYYHGMISQIPNTIYTASLARTRQYKTPIAHISVHHIQPAFFFGFEMLPNSLAKMATPEKALLDVFYLSFTRSLLFSSLPELEIPRSFRKKEALKMIEKIPTLRIRSMVHEKFKRCMERHRE